MMTRRFNMVYRSSFGTWARSLGSLGALGICGALTAGCSGAVESVGVDGGGGAPGSTAGAGNGTGSPSGGSTGSGSGGGAGGSGSGWVAGGSGSASGSGQTGASGGSAATGATGQGGSGGSAVGGSSGSTTACEALPIPSGVQTTVCQDGSPPQVGYELVSGQCVLAETCPVPVQPPEPCMGALPSLCEVCSDGTSACAHFTIRNGVCVVEFCPPVIAPPPSGGCVQGATCFGYSTMCAVDTQDGCQTECVCDANYRFQCASACSGTPYCPPGAPCAQPPPIQTPCVPGGFCQGNEGCGGASQGNPSCQTSCTCVAGAFSCGQTCAEEAGVGYPPPMGI